MLNRINGLLLGVWARIQDARGQAMPEYGLLVALIAVVCIIAVTAVGLAVSGKFDDVKVALGGS